MFKNTKGQNDWPTESEGRAVEDENRQARKNIDHISVFMLKNDEVIFKQDWNDITFAFLNYLGLTRGDVFITD